MIHKIKAMHDKGDGTSIKEISRSLGVSRNTVRKYLRMDEQTIQETLDSPERFKILDQYLVELAQGQCPAVVAVHKLLDGQPVAILKPPQRGQLALVIKQEAVIFPVGDHM